MDAEIYRCQIATDEANRCDHDSDGKRRPNVEQHAIHCEMWIIALEAGQKVRLHGTQAQKDEIDDIMLERWSMFWDGEDYGYIL